MQLTGKKIIVTGGASGIAAGTVREYVREGATGKAIFYRCNIAKAEEVFSVFNQAANDMGGLDTLAHIAGVELLKAAEEYTVDDMDFQFDVNIKGTILTNQAACNIFKEQEGEENIINFASDTASTGMPGGALYATSKGAVYS